MCSHGANSLQFAILGHCDILDLSGLCTGQHLESTATSCLQPKLQSVLGFPETGKQEFLPRRTECEDDNPANRCLGDHGRMLACPEDTDYRRGSANRNSEGRIHDSESTRSNVKSM